MKIDIWTLIVVNCKNLSHLKEKKNIVADVEREETRNPSHLFFYTKVSEPSASLANVSD